MAKITYSSTSMYSVTPQSSWFLGHWNPPNIYPDGTDEYKTVPNSVDQKPWMWANQLYGNPELGWIFQWFNMDLIKNGDRDFRGGMVLRVPLRRRVVGNS